VVINVSALVAAPRERVYAALNDRDVLRRSIPGCEELADIDERTFSVTLKLGVAGIKGTYAGTASRQDLRPPESLTFALDGKGKAGFIRGTAVVRIADEQGKSRVGCEADVQIGGAIAAVGSRLIGAAARKLTGDFFREFALAIGAPPGPLGHEGVPEDLQ
jgi:carbon monoxide dehydrogenase subunit G